MTTKEYNDYQAMAALGLMPDEENPVFIFNGTNKDLLLDIANGRLDAVQLARIQLRERGFNIETGKWVGWKTQRQF